MMCTCRMKTKNKIDPTPKNNIEGPHDTKMENKRRPGRRSVGGRIEKRSEVRQTKVSLRRRLNHLLRKTKSGSSVGPESLNTSETEVTVNDDNLELEKKCSSPSLECNVENHREEHEEEDGGALSLADLESDQLSPFVTRHAGSTPKLFKVQQNVSIPKSVQKAVGIDVKKSGSKRRSRNRSSPSDRSCSPGGFFSSLTSRASLKEFRGSRHKEFTSSGASSSGSKVFARDAGSTPCRSRQSSRRFGKENKPERRKSPANLGASLDLKGAKESILTEKGTPVTSSKKLPARVCQLVNENLFCISGMSALTINTPPSAYRKMAFGNHSMVTRSMTKNKETGGLKGSKNTKEENEKGIQGEANDDFGVSVYEASPKVRVRKRLSLLDSSMASSKAEPIETDFPYEGDSILARGPSSRFSRQSSLRDSQISIGKDVALASTMNATLSSLHSILEDTELTTQHTLRTARGSMRNTSVASASYAPVSHFITPSSKLRKSAKHRNASSTATCTRHDQKFATPEQKLLLKATVKRSKSVTFSNKKEVTISRLNTSDRRQKSHSLRRKPVASSEGSVRVEMREDAGHTPKPSRKKQEPVDERLI